MDKETVLHIAEAVGVKRVDFKDGGPVVYLGTESQMLAFAKACQRHGKS